MGLDELLRLAQSGARGFTTGLLGAPVDIANTMLGGVGGKKPVMGGEWIGDKLQNIGLLAPQAGDLSNAAAEFAGGLLNPGGGAAVAGKAAAGAKGLLGGGSLAQIVFHGSPHTFDKFDINKIGTGEGAQAYGHGLYFAENPNVARSYANNLATVKVNGSEITDDLDSVLNMVTGERKAAAMMVKEMGYDKALATARADLAREQHPYFDGIVQEIQSLKNVPVEINKNLYKVDIPDEAIGKMLDWDKPLTAQQSQQVLKALGSVQPVALGGGYFGAVRVGPDGVGKRIAGIEYPSRAQAQEQINLMFKDRKGEDAYRLLSGILGGPEAASAALKNAGVPGLRYFDGNSRGASNGTRNFVLFDDKLAKITKRE
jgi:hypothetical protein